MYSGPGPVPPPWQSPPQRRRRRPFLIIVGLLVGVLLLIGLGLGIGMVAFGDDDTGKQSERAATTTTPPPSPSDIPGMVPSRFAGKWVGGGKYLAEDDKRYPFKTLVDLTPQTRSGSSKLTFDNSFDCDAVLQVRSFTPDRLILYQFTTKGHRSGQGCEETPTGYVALKLRPDGKIDYRYYADRRSLDLDDWLWEALLTRS